MTTNNLGPHALLSGDNPYHPRKIPGNNASVAAALRAMGEDAVETKGSYGAPEDSIMIRNPKDHQKIMDLARDHGQDAVLFSDGENHKMTYLHGDKAGKYNPGRGTTFHATKPDDYYTIHPDGRFFTHNIDFDRLLWDIKR